jgi:predicted ATPase
MAQKQDSISRQGRRREGITRITVGGFKSISEEQSIEVRPLTILAGANSSGKSSIMQPLLLLKQTLEAPYDPGALLLNGPNVKFTSVDQLLARMSGGEAVNIFHVGIEVSGKTTITTSLKRNQDKGLEVEETTYDTDKGKYRLYREMTPEEFQSAVLAAIEVSSVLIPDLREIARQLAGGFLDQARGFLVVDLGSGSDENGLFMGLVTQMPGEVLIKAALRQTIHLPGLRGSPERTYPVTAVGAEFPGTFENYVASVIRQWQKEGNNKKLEAVNRDLARLGLTGKVIARAIDDTQVELRVNRLFRGNKSNTEDMVSVADVGLGISQTLPVVVALHVADEGQLVYLEQPEIHLHPRAQVAMAEVLADAAKQGKRLVVETHSSLLLRGIQTLVAEGKLPPELVKLHWFTLRTDGSTEITSADLDETGAFGDWPEDFDTVTLDTESRYLDAAQARLEEK